MKKSDKNIIIIAALGVIGVLMWTFSQYSSSQNKTSEEIKPKQEELLESQEQKRRNDIVREENIISTISATELNQKIMLTDEITVVDMRSREKYDDGHIRGSIPVEVMDPAQLDRTVVFVTENGLENSIVQYYNSLSQTRNIYNLEGGITAWRESGFALLSLNIPMSFAAASKVQFVEPRDVDALLKDPKQLDEILILDVRRSGNYEKGHIAHAINIPLAEIEMRYKELPRRKEIYVYGADEETSFSAGVILYDLRHINTKTMKGGLAAWKEYGYPTTTE